MENLKVLLQTLVGEAGNVDITEYNGNENYEAVLRLKLANDEDKDFSRLCTEWMQKFCTATKTQWIVRNSWPNLKKLIYRKLYVCHHSNFNKVLV